MKKGLTLVEVIVVIAILATLTALITPAIYQAREEFKRTEAIKVAKEKYKTGTFVYNRATQEEGSILRKSSDCLSCFLVRVKKGDDFQERTWMLEEFSNDKIE